MSCTVAITQPTYLPWLGYFELIRQADVFVFLDTVQFEKQSWQSRNRIKTPGDEVIWLSVPVASHPLDTPIRDIHIAERPANWNTKQLKTVQQSLGRAPHFDAVYQQLTALLKDPPDLLADLNISFITRIANALDSRCKFVRASELAVSGRRESLLITICRHFGASRYYSNAGSAVYLEKSRGLFEEAGIALDFQRWPHPQYPQFGKNFVSHLSSIDALMHLGFEEVRIRLQESA